MPQEIELLQAAMDGNAAAFEQVVKKYQSLVCAITFSGTGRVDVSEELAQETFLSAWKNLRQLTDPSGFRPWLCTIARNMLNNYYRKKKTVPLDPADIADLSDQTPSPADNLISQEEHIMLEQALMQIPAEYREPLVMYYRQEKSTREVAIGLGLNESTVRTRLHRARQMLREEIAARLERTLERTAPDKTFTKAVMLAVGTAAVGLSATTSAASAAAANAAGTSAPTGIAALMSTVSAKIITAAAIAAIAVGGVVAYKQFNQPDQPPVQSGEVAVVPAKQESIVILDSPESDSQEKQEVAGNPIEVPEIQTAIAPTDLDTGDAPKIQIETVANNVDSENAAKIDDETGFRISLKVLDKESGKPIANADIRTYDGKSRFAATDPNGIYVVTRPGEGPTSINLFAAKDGYVGQSFTCGEGRLIEYFPEEVVFKLEKGTTIGGIVHDAAGDPLQDAKVRFTISSGDALNQKGPETDERFEQLTDKDGRWMCTTAPKDLTWVTLDVDHPDYAQSHVYVDEAETIEQLRSQAFVISMDQGFIISGVVQDENGNPVPDARVQRGVYYAYKESEFRGYTDPNGYFEFTKLSTTFRTETVYEKIEGKGNVPVKRPVEFITVSAEGYAPEIKKVTFNHKKAQIEVILSSGSPICGRVIDFEGNAVSGAAVRADKWYDPESSWDDHINSIDWRTRTDAEGRFIWQNAPNEEVKLEITKAGFLEFETPKLLPSETEHEFVLNPKVRVFGRVIDAATKEPVSEFIYRRHEGGTISHPKLVTNDKGRFETSFENQGERFFISFEADGYKPVNSNSIALIDQNVELTIEMQPDTGLEGVIVDADGKPVEGVRIVIPDTWLSIDNMEIPAAGIKNHTNTITDSRGRFHLAPTATDSYDILALDDAGYLYLNSENFPPDGRFVLQPYAKIIGTYFKGSKPVSHQTVRIDYPHYHQIQKPNGVWKFGMAVNYRIETDEQGAFVFDKLIHGTARILIDPYREIEVEVGKTYEIHIGGDGLTVQGAVLNPHGQLLTGDFGECALGFQKIYDVLPIPEDELPLPDNADAMTYAELLDWFTEFSDSDEGRQWQEQMEQKYGSLTGGRSFEIDSNGWFEVPNVTPGTYLFTVTVRPWKNPDRFPRMADYSRTIAQASAMFIVPEFDTFEEMEIPVDLGTLKCRPAPLAAGQKAPDFDIPKLKSTGRIRLSDYRGKTVLVNFANPELKESEPEKAAILEQLCQQAKGRVTIVNVALEMLPWNYMRQKMIPECTLPGLYGVATAHNSKIYADYITVQSSRTRTLPCSVLIDPAGTILWIGSPSEEIFKDFEPLEL